ncbi:hypothetical protein D4R51_01200 [bacterium]|nr:MAG: hypothetical protein D4R51_01200 [bacterium]
MTDQVAALPSVGQYLRQSMQPAAVLMVKVIARAALNPILVICVRVGHITMIKLRNTPSGLGAVPDNAEELR